jgi:hypothetical protein
MLVAHWTVDSKGRLTTTWVYVDKTATKKAA